MESPRKNNDCYFYYYSTCLKGDGCLFRHEPSALGCETVCTFWQQGKCLNQHCNFRHMELRKNRKIIPCYWENQPGGCRKPHCSFLHKLPREPIGGDLEKAKDCENVAAGKPLERPEWSRRTVLTEGAQYEECVGSSDNDSTRVGPRRVSQSSEASYGSPPVDPLVVNFEEESDNESVPTSTPTKKPQKNIHVKTLEEIRLERIQAESAAFYSYDHSSVPNPSDDLRSWIDTRKMYHKPAQDFKVLSLEEIRKSRAFKENEEVDVKDESFYNISVSSRQVANNYLCNDKENNGVGYFSGAYVKTEPKHMEIEDNCYPDNGFSKFLPKITHDGDNQDSDCENRKLSLKRSHSPIIFTTSQKKLSIIKKERKCNSVSDEDESKNISSEEIGVEWKLTADSTLVETSQPSKRIRKPLRRTQQCERPSRQRLRRGNMVHPLNSLDVSESLKDSEVSFTVPVVDKVGLVCINGQSQSSLGTLEDVPMDTSEIVNQQNAEFSSLSSRLKDSHTFTDSSLLVHSSVNEEDSLCKLNMESESLSSSKIDRSNRCSTESADEELLMDSQDNGMTLEADEDILQDIDDLLKD